MSNLLIPCETCQNEIASTAKECPKCGAVNDWKHPEITRFLKNTENIDVPNRYYYKHTATSLVFTYTNIDRRRKWFSPARNWGKVLAFYILFWGAYLADKVEEGTLIGVVLIPIAFIGGIFRPVFIYLMNWISFGFGGTFLALLFGIVLPCYALVGMISSMGQRLIDPDEGQWMVNTPREADKYLIIDFSENPTKWETNNAEFWSELIKFLKL